MEKNKILELSRKENKGHDAFENEVLARAGSIAMSVGGVVCMLIVFLNVIFSDRSIVSYTAWAIYLTMTGTQFLYKFIKLRKKHELVIAIFDLILAVIFFVFVVTDIVKGY